MFNSVTRQYQNKHSKKVYTFGLLNCSQCSMNPEAVKWVWVEDCIMYHPSWSYKGTLAYEQQCLDMKFAYFGGKQNFLNFEISVLNLPASTLKFFWFWSWNPGCKITTTTQMCSIHTYRVIFYLENTINTIAYGPVTLFCIILTYAIVWQFSLIQWCTQIYAMRMLGIGCIRLEHGGIRKNTAASAETEIHF